MLRAMQDKTFVHGLLMWIRRRANNLHTPRIGTARSIRITPVLVGVCTHIGCILNLLRGDLAAFQYTGGYICPCCAAAL